MYIGSPAIHRVMRPFYGFPGTWRARLAGRPERRVARPRRAVPLRRAFCDFATSNARRAA
ncbi:hypothetical protein GSH05_31145 [Burkholderia pseudomallei]|nr:hypothetical protein EGY15_30520 [Burkholderia pseudomallei]PNX02010.1 hypothetical protein CF649_17950 [Burkholderia sp. 136(2017)]PNX14868.1 hypothetical protein CF650_13930 [Burkholderia sp. 129]PNX28307.1 hypothetical protein CF647_18270 [Burkholderia sp. 117]PNX37265.1 hypothetical protein CF648_18860 [Burkholderia sp. 137]